MADAGVVEAALGGDAGALDLFLGGDLGFAEGLHAGDLELLGGALALQAGGVHRLLALDVDLDAALRGDLGAAHLGLVLGAGALLLGEFDDALLVRGLHVAALLDVEDVAGLRRGDAVLLDPEFGGDALALALVALFQLARLGRLLALDLGGAGLLLGGDAGGVERLLLGDAGLLHRLVGGDLRLIEGLDPGDLELAHLAGAGVGLARDLAHADLALRLDAGGLGRLARRSWRTLGRAACAPARRLGGAVDGAIAGDLALAHVLLVGDALAGEGLSRAMRAPSRRDLAASARCRSISSRAG